MQNCHKNHKFEIISANNIGFDQVEVVRWCSNCGGVVVDLDIDKQTNPGYYMKFKLPAIGKKILEDLINTKPKAPVA